MMSSWAPDRMNSCMSWRLFQMLIVQNSVGLAMMLAQRTTSPVRLELPADPQGGVEHVREEPRTLQPRTGGEGEQLLGGLTAGPVGLIQLFLP